MIKLFKKLFDWLDKRFPPKVVVAESDLRILSERMDMALSDHNFNAGQISAHLGRIQALEKSVTVIKDVLAKNGNITIKTEAEKLRDQFIHEGHIRNQ